MRCGTHPPHRRQSTHHSILFPTTGGRIHTCTRGISPPTNLTPTPPPHSERGLARGLGRHLLKRHSHRLSPICDMDLAHNPHLHTTPTARSGHVDRLSHNLGSSKLVSTGGGHSNRPICFPGSQRGNGSDTSPDPNRCGHSPSPRQTPASTYVPKPYPGPHLIRMKSNVAVDSYASTLLAKAMALSLLDSMSLPS